MATDEISQFLRQMRSGSLDAENPAFPGHLSAADFVKQVRDHYPVVFQQRAIGRKSELGLARSLKFEPVVLANLDQTFPLMLLFPIFHRCVLISTYDNRLSGIAVAKSIRIRPSKDGADQLVVTMGRGYKLDKMPNGWTRKEIPRRSTVLSESFLRARGWQFDCLRPFAIQSK